MDENRPKTGLDDPRAVEILTTEHWSLLTSRTLGYQEVFGRTTIFVAILSATIVALALMAQATQFSPLSLLLAALLMAVNLFIGLMTFARSVAINYEDARWVAGMDLLRQAYLKIVPELKSFLTAHHGQPLAYGAPQQPGNLAKSLTTTSSVVAALNSVLAGALTSDILALLGAARNVALWIGAAVSIVSAGVHVAYAARYRKRHSPERPG